MALDPQAFAQWNMADAKLEDVEPWKPVPGDFLAGTLVEVRTIESNYDGMTKLWLIIEAQDGTRYGFIPPTSPQRQVLERMKNGIIDIGKPIGFKYVGDKKVNHGMLKQFVVFPELSKEVLSARARDIVKQLDKQTPVAPEEETGTESVTY